MIKKGQLMGQPFVYIFIIIVVALVLFFGIKLLIGLLDFGESAEFNKFTNLIETKIDKVHSDSYGSTISLDNILVPSSITEVCIIDRSLEDFDSSLVKDEDLKEFVSLSWSGNRDENMFFASEDVEFVEMDYLVLEGVNPLCDKTHDRKLDIKLTNQGNIILAEHI